MKRSREESTADSGVRPKLRLGKSWYTKLPTVSETVISVEDTLQTLQIVYIGDFFAHYEHFDKHGKFPEGVAAASYGKDVYRFLVSVVRTAMQRIDSLQPINASAALVVAILIGNRSAKTASLKVVGVAVVEEVERAFRAALVPVDSGAGLRHALQAGDVWCTGTVCCGVQLMWVADALRRNNICRNMIECARKHLCYGQEIQKEYVAFLEPTEMGIRFAQKYAGRDDFLVYY